MCYIETCFQTNFPQSKLGYRFEGSPQLMEQAAEGSMVVGSAVEVLSTPACMATN